MDYTYLGYTEDRRIVKGRISAADEQAAVDTLSNIGYRVVTLKPVIAFLPNVGGLFKRGVKPAELVTFLRQLALLLESGVDIVHSLELLQAQTPDRSLRKMLIEVVSDIRGGRSLADALERHPHVFPSLYCRLVSVGEHTGALETILRNVADHLERQAATTAKIRQALMYPTIVFFLAIIVGAVMVTMLLPAMIDLFSSMGGELPLPTRILIGLLNFLQHYGLYVFVAILALVVVGFIYSRTPGGRYSLHTLILKIPLIGRLALVNELARICRSISLLFKAGVPLPEVMSMTTKATGNQVVARALGEVERGMLRGQGIARPMSTTRVFLPLMVEMTRVGEETGNLDESLVIVAENYEIEAERRTQTLLSLIEPAMTIAMGLGVGFLALSVFMPIYGSLSLVGG